MCQLITPPTPKPVAQPTCPAKTLSPEQRRTIALQALAGTHTQSELATQHDVSRKFVARQTEIARGALQHAFEPDDDHERVLFHLPVTKTWIRQLVLGLILINHSSYRGVHELLRDLFDFSLSTGSIHNIIHNAARKAEEHNLRTPLDAISIAGLDEIFQNRKPVLVGVDTASTYCFLLQAAEQRDGETWGLHLMDLQQRGFAPQATVADFGTGLRCGQALALPEVPCRGDLFHVLADITPVTTYLDNRAYKAIETHDRLRHQHLKTERREAKNPKARQTSRLPQLAEQIASAHATAAAAIRLADEVELLMSWLHRDVFAISGMDSRQREECYDFIVAELEAREALCPHRIAPLRKLLASRRNDLLAFAVQLDRDSSELANTFEVSKSVVREMVDVQVMDERRTERWIRDAALRDHLGSRYHDLSEAVRAMREQVVRASSVVENLNSRLRPYFFLRKRMGNSSLSLLQFFLNHRRFLRSEHESRRDRSPAEILTGPKHPHWLELLGYQPFVRTQSRK